MHIRAAAFVTAFIIFCTGSAFSQEAGQALLLDNLTFTEGGDFVHFPEHDYGLTDELTVAAWIRWESDPNSTISNPHEPTQNKWANLVTSDFHDAVDQGQFSLQHNSGNTKFEWAVRSGSTRRSIFSNTAPVVHTWYYVVGVYDGNPAQGNIAMRMYVNGEEESTANTAQISGSIRSHDKRMRLNFGRIPSDYRLFNGQMDEVRIWKRALGREEIRKQMHSTGTVNPAGMVGYYPMNSTTGSAVEDSTGSAQGTFYTVLVDVHSVSSFLCESIPFSDFTSSAPWQIADGDKDWSAHDLSGLPTRTVSGAGVNQENSIISNNCNTMRLVYGWSGSGADTIVTPVLDGQPYDTWLGVEDEAQTSQWVASRVPVTGEITFVRSTTTATTGGSGAQMGATITSTPDSSNNVLLYTYGAASDPPVDSESYSSGIDARAGVVWGHAVFGSVSSALTFDYSGIPGIPDPSSVVLLRRHPSGESWTAVPVTGLTHSTLTRSFTLTGVTDGYEYAIGVNLALNPLPVELVGLHGHRKAGGILLQWQTATEINSLAFEVQARTEGDSDWNTLSTLQAAGNSNVPRSYRWSHLAAPAAEMQYRLRMLDRDGSVALSPRLTVAAEGSTKPEVGLYPNPASEEASVTLTLSDPDVVRIHLHDMLGRRVLRLPALS
ncbi:MAG: LamG-like jellyroll fold domain-containing protein, partial [Bacteroidota bacterium]|nr:LamG-like jellyroll fold domain-containing protein [Bacteroidota bacterium]